MKSDNSSDSLWYKEGLRFACTECGQCCTGAPGAVWVSEEETEAIAASLDIPADDFRKTSTRMIDGRRSLNEKPSPNGFDCIFLKNKRCTIYSERPKQCRTFPWWPTNLESPEAWKCAASHCEGIREDAPLVTIDQIKKQQQQ